MDQKENTAQGNQKAIHRYLAKFIEMKIRVYPDEHQKIKDHAASMGESATAFMKRAVTETMERDQQNMSE